MDALEPSPDAPFYPGVPRVGTVPTTAPVARTVNGSMAAAGWQCLGVWAMAGRPVNVTLPASLVNIGATLHISEQWAGEASLRLPHARAGGCAPTCCRCDAAGSFSPLLAHP